MFVDDGISGTSIRHRVQFQEMIERALAGEIDLILTKSIQRFARNTLDLLLTVRKLREVGVAVRFEKEHIDTSDGSGDLMLSILASFAEQESRSISENVKWGIEKRFQEGIPHYTREIFGYRWNGEQFEVVEEEAEVVRQIYDYYLSGLSYWKVADQLNESGIASPKDKGWSDVTVMKILSNPIYTGDLLLGKYFYTDPIRKQQKKNNGERPSYLVEEAHEAIISKDQFQAVATERERRVDIGPRWSRDEKPYPFTKRLVCGHCGAFFAHSFQNGTEVWECTQALRKKRETCPNSPIIPDDQLREICTQFLGLNAFDEQVFEERVDSITVLSDLQFKFKDGSTTTVPWNRKYRDRSLTEEWKKTISLMNSDRHASQYAKAKGDLTGFLKCADCGSNLRTAPLGDDYIRNCPTCHKGRYRESVIKKMICKVMGIPEFSVEEMDRNLHHAVVDDDLIHFHFHDGKVVTRRYFYRTNDFNDFLVCAECGQPLKTRNQVYKDGATGRQWRCRCSSENQTIQDQDLRDLVARELSLSEFDPLEMNERISKIESTRAGVILYFRDGSIKECELQFKKKKQYVSPKTRRQRSRRNNKAWTPEKRAAMSEKAKERYRNAKENYKDCSD